jgi:hypothetical protein
VLRQPRGVAPSLRRDRPGGRPSAAVTRAAAADVAGDAAVTIGQLTSVLILGVTEFP